MKEIIWWAAVLTSIAAGLAAFGSLPGHEVGAFLALLKVFGVFGVVVALYVGFLIRFLHIIVAILIIGGLVVFVGQIALRGDGRDCVYGERGQMICEE